MERELSVGCSLVRLINYTCISFHFVMIQVMMRTSSLPVRWFMMVFHFNMKHCYRMTFWFWTNADPPQTDNPNTHNKGLWRLKLNPLRSSQLNRPELNWGSKAKPCKNQTLQVSSHCLRPKLRTRVHSGTRAVSCGFHLFISKSRSGERRHSDMKLNIKTTICPRSRSQFLISGQI